MKTHDKLAHLMEYHRIELLEWLLRRLADTELDYLHVIVHRDDNNWHRDNHGDGDVVGEEAEHPMDLIKESEGDEKP